MKEMKKKILIVLLIGLFSLGFILAASTINFQAPTPLNSSTTLSPISIVANISDAYNTSSWIDFDNSLVGYWAMDYANSTHVYDNSSYKMHATFNGGLGTSDIITGVRGNALNFDGGTNYLQVPISQDYTKMTYSYWINNDFEIANIPSGSYECIYYYTSGSDYGCFFADDRYIANFHNGTGQQHFVNWYPSTVNQSEWHQIISVVDADAAYVALYLDGDLIQNRTYSSWTVGTKSTLRIGTWYSYYYNGSIDEFMLFNRTFSSTEVKALYNSQVNNFNTSEINLANGQHNYTLSTINLNGETSNSGLRNFIISSDSNIPTITFQVPTPSNTSSTSSPVTIVANISDSLDTSSFIDFDRTLLAYWAMDYYNGTGFYDNSSWNNFLGFSGGAGTSDIMAGKRGDAFDFDIDGGDQLSRDSLALGNSATFETWAYAYSYTTMPMLWNQPNPTYTSYYDLFFISNTICLNTGDSGSNPFKYPNGTNIPLTSISLNEWHHYAVVIDSTLNQALLYIDGTYFGNASYRTPANTAGTRIMYVGGPSSSYRWNGSIDEFKIYNRSLSAAEVTAAYSSKSNKFNTSAISLADGQHNYTVYAVDEVGNFVSSGWRNFVVTSGGGDSTPPTINFESPTPNNGSSTSSPVTIVANISDASNTSSWIDLDRTLVGYWAMDYANSTHVYDNSSYRNIATFVNGVGTSNISIGIRGDSLEFDGTNDYTSVSNLGATTNQTFNNSGQLTFSAWINPDALTAYHGIMGSQTVRFHVTSSNFILVTIYNRTGSNQLTSSTVITTGEWQHVALTYNRSNGNATVYRNGINIGSKDYLEC